MRRTDEEVAHHVVLLELRTTYALATAALTTVAVHLRALGVTRRGDGDDHVLAHVVDGLGLDFQITGHLDGSTEVVDHRGGTSGRTVGIQRSEFEYPIPLVDAEEMLDRLDRLAAQTNRSRNELINLLLDSAMEIVKVEE